MKRIQRGPVRGISLKLQEEERERRMDFVPDESAVNTDNIEVDKDTMEMLRSLNMANLPGVQLQAVRCPPTWTTLSFLTPPPLPQCLPSLPPLSGAPLTTCNSPYLQANAGGYQGNKGGFQKRDRN